MSKESQLIIINSAQRANGTSSQFQYNLPYEAVPNTLYYRVNKITIPFSFYPTLAQTFVIIYNGTPHTISLPGGQYTPSSLINTLTNLTNTAIGAGTLVWTYTSTPAPTFTVAVGSGGNTFTINWVNNNLPAANNLFYSIGYQMGFFDANYLPFILQPVAGSFSSVIYPNLSGFANIYVKSQALQIYTSSLFNQIEGDVIQSIPIEVNPSNFIVWMNTYPINFQGNPSRGLSSLDFTLCDEFGTVLNLNGQNWTIEFEVFYVA